VPWSTPTHRCQDVTHTHRQKKKDSRGMEGVGGGAGVNHTAVDHKAFSRYHLSILGSNDDDFNFALEVHKI